MTPLEKAQELLSMKPLPDDAEQRLDALYAEASAEEKPFIATLYEALFVAEYDYESSGT